MAHMYMVTMSKLIQQEPFLQPFGMVLHRKLDGFILHPPTLIVFLQVVLMDPIHLMEITGLM